jgi:hypothetical protein
MHIQSKLLLAKPRRDKRKGRGKNEKRQIRKNSS